jgi:penicillin-binding protein 1B
MFPTPPNPPAPPAGGVPRAVPAHRRRRVWIVLGVAAALGLAGWGRFAAEVRALQARQATGPAWAFPSRVWSDAVVLSAGSVLPRARLEAHLALRGYRAVGARPPATGEWRGVPGGLEIGLRAGVPTGPGPAAAPERVRVILRDGRVARVQRAAADTSLPPPRLEPMLLASIADSHRVARRWVPLTRVPRALRDAVVAAEDRRFRSHLGVDLRGNLRAMATNVRAGGVRQGASTITQQLARGLWLGPERTLSRKLGEMVLAAGLERVLSKDEILEMYLNLAYFGRDAWGGFAGVGEASERLFGMPVDSLDLPRAALLAGVIPAPNLFSPLRRPEAARRRRAAVLRDMVEAGVLDSATAAQAAAAPLRLAPVPPPRERFPSVVTAVRQELAAQFPAHALEGHGLEVLTTVDAVAQATAERELALALAEQEAWAGRGPEPLQGAFVLLAPAAAEVRALVGGREPRPGDFNRATQARRQPGSAIKPVAYAAALDPRRGAPRFTPASTVPDLRRGFDTPEGRWEPRNDEGEYHASVTLTKALAKSLNLATANLVEQVGAAAVARAIERFGLGRPAAVASIGLGTHEVTPLALTAAYAVFPRGGTRREPTLVRAVVGAGGRPRRLRERRPVEVLPAVTAALVTAMLEEVVTFGIAHPLRAQYGFTRPCGGKTGTTNDYLDAWFVGLTADAVASVWVGFDTPASLRRPAARVALPVWARVMSAVTAAEPVQPLPTHPEVTRAWLDPWTGGRARPDCPSPLRVPVVVGAAPTAVCDRDHAADWEAIRAAAAADSVARAVADSTARADSLAALPHGEPLTR